MIHVFSNLNIIERHIYENDNKTRREIDIIIRSIIIEKRT